MFKRKKKYEMNTMSAGIALQNVLVACDKDPNRISFDKVLLQEEANTKPYERVMNVIIVLILLTFLAPFGIIPASTFYEKVTAPEPVAVVSDYVKDGQFYLYLSGDDIQFEDAYIQTTDGTVISPASYNAKEKVLCFPYHSDTESNIYIPVKDQPPVHLLLTPVE